MGMRHLNMGWVKQVPSLNDRGENDEEQGNASWRVVRSWQEGANEASRTPGAVNSELAAGHLPSKPHAAFPRSQETAAAPASTTHVGGGVPKA